MCVVDLFFDDLTEDAALEEITEQPGQERVIVVYARASANENRPNLDSQAERLCTYCTAKGWKVVKVVKEVSSGVNDGRKKLLALLADPTMTVIVVEHKDRLNQTKNVVSIDVHTFWNYTNQKWATTFFPLLSAQSFERENAVTF